ncbi:sirohydrochlorin chelatase [Paraliobacillus salinarum]|uniref:sirohydrochlorin chelatase n=1 Tax=Paraliobacillus salinarum TaxID=1158996 RepID=UPI0015F3F4A8|nr:CbiX/SirB N-terminal domain-containing protein [Paraliobacillus salinarum]
MQAVIYVAHGSKEKQTNDKFTKAIQSIIEMDDNQTHRIAFLEANPSLAQIIDQCIDYGVNEIIVVPIFLLPGVHVTSDIPTILKQKNKQYPRSSFYYAPAFNAAEEIVEDTYQRVKEAQELHSANQPQAVCIISHGSRNKQASDVFQDFSKALQNKLNNMPVYQAYVTSSKPTIEEKISKLQKKNDDPIIVVPHFLTFTMFPTLIKERISAISTKEWIFINGIGFNSNIKKLIKRQISLAERIN